MKLKASKDTTTLSIGDIDAKAFGVDTSNGVIFDILRNKMYSNKIAAVAREISSNSRDANRENGKTDVPIEISIVAPNELINSTDMQIMFKDAGVGITPDRMENIFLKYGASSKRNTNKQTGGFGLGAKTPFAYTDTFTIITVCDHEGKRMKYIYTASITDRAGIGSGEMILFSAEETKDVTGTGIVVPIKESDRSEFEQEIYRATSFWTVQPKFKGFDSEPWKLEVEVKGKGYRIVRDSIGWFDDPGYLLIIDGIPYAVDRGQVNLSGDFLHNTGMILCFEYKNGDLTISANREAVQYDRQTKIKMLWKIRQIKNAFRDEMNTKFAACKTYLDACVFANQMEGFTEDPKKKVWTYIYKWLRGFVFKFGGKDLSKEANFLYHDVYRYDHYDANGKLFGLEMSKRRFDEKWQFPMYKLASGKRNVGRNATLMDAKGFLLIVPAKITLRTDGKDAAQTKFYQETYDKAIERQQEEEVTLQEFGVTINDYNLVVPKVLPKGHSDSVYTKTNDVGVQCRRIGDRSHYTNWTPCTITFLRKEKTTKNAKQYIYCTTDKLSHMNSYSSESPELPTTKELQQGILAAKLLKLDYVCVPERDAHYFADANMLTIEAAWKLVEADQALIDKIVEAKNFQACNQLQLPEGWMKLKLTGRIDAAIEAVIEMTKDKKNKTSDLIDLELNSIDIKASVSTSGIKTALNLLFKKYPLLEFFIAECRSYGYSNNSTKAVRHMNKVMDIVDSYKVAEDAEDIA